MTIANKLLPEFDEEFGLARKFLSLVPDDKLAWKPHEKVDGTRPSRLAHR